MEALLKELTSKETLKTIIVSLGQRSVDGAVGKGGKVRVQVTDINRLSHYSIYHFDPSTEIRDVKKRIIQDLWYGNDNKEIMLEVRSSTIRREVSDTESLESILQGLGQSNTPPITINLCASQKICLSN